MNPIKKIAVTLLAIDVIWATIMATFGARLITQLGLAAGSDPGLSYVSGFSGWIITFLAALFQGGIFLAVGSVFFTIGLVIYSKLPAGGKKVVHWALLADVVWAALFATFGASVMAQAIGLVGVSGSAAAINAVLLWCIAFVAAYFQGLVFMTVGAGFIFVISVIVIAFSGNNSKGGTGSNSADTTSTNDRNPGEPPLR
ncbi:MAG: hypothetical protein IPO31_24135 [Candidatus Obscuribacter sp.]|nr:hypothetical protein [Candidatus Obscuribacter sp.]